MLGTVASGGSVSFDRTGVPVTVEVVIDLDTLRGEQDALALVEGQPVPADLAR